MNNRSLKCLVCLVLMGAVLVGCKSSMVRDRHIPAEVRTDQPTEGRPTLAMPIALPESDTLVVPFTLERPKRWLEDADQFELESTTVSKSEYVRASVAAYQYGGGSGVGQSRSVRWHNAVFQQIDGYAWLALDQRGVISQFDLVGHWVVEKQEEDEKTMRFVCKGVLLTATVEDTDGDGELTSRDANILIAGDADGKGLHTITPPGTQVRSMSYNEKLDRVLILVVSDSNGDLAFTDADSAAPYQYRPGDDSPATPLVHPNVIEQAEQQLK